MISSAPSPISERMPVLAEMYIHSRTKSRNAGAKDFAMMSQGTFSLRIVPLIIMFLAS